MKLEDFKPGQAVIYFRTGQRGVVTSVNREFVFVRYDFQHPTAGGQATRPEDLDHETRSIPTR